MAIRKDVVIDFPLPELIRNTMMDTEKAFEEDGEYGPYMNWVDSLDNVCKGFYAGGVITKKQWDLIMSRYQLDD